MRRQAEIKENKKKIQEEQHRQELALLDKDEDTIATKELNIPIYEEINPLEDEHLNHDEIARMERLLNSNRGHIYQDFAK